MTTRPKPPASPSRFLNGRLLTVLLLATLGTVTLATGSFHIGARTAHAHGKVGPGDRVCWDAAGEPGDFSVVNLTPVDADAGGNGQLLSSDVRGIPNSSNVNFAVGTVDPNIAIAEIGTDGQVCFQNSNHTHVHLVADELGTIDQASFSPARESGASERKLDTRKSDSKIGPGERVCWADGSDLGEFGVYNLTPVEAEGGGNGQLLSSDVEQAPNSSNVNFAEGTVDPNVAFARVGDDGEVCYQNSSHAAVHLVADQLGVLDSESFSPARASGASARQLDTRTADSNLASGQRTCWKANGHPGDFSVVNLTPVEAEAGGNGQLLSSDVKNAPTSSNVNFFPGSTDPNVAIAKISQGGEVCFENSNHTAVHLVADELGTIDGSVYSPAQSSGASERKLDTREATSPTDPENPYIIPIDQVPEDDYERTPEFCATTSTGISPRTDELIDEVAAYPTVEPAIPVVKDFLETNPTRSERSYALSVLASQTEHLIGYDFSNPDDYNYIFNLNENATELSPEAPWAWTRFSEFLARAEKYSEALHAAETAMGVFDGYAEELGDCMPQYPDKWYIQYLIDFNREQLGVLG